MSTAEYIHWLKRDWAKTGFILSIFLLVFLMVFVRKVDAVGRDQRDRGDPHH